MVRRRVFPVNRSFFGLDAAGEALGRVMQAMNTCSHCRKQRATLKLCSRCKQASYCGAECQNAAWKGHKKRCVTLDDVWGRFYAASERKDWREVLKWEGRMEEMMEHVSDEGCNAILVDFSDAHRGGLDSSGDTDHALSIVQLETRRVEVLGKIQRFRDQGKALFIIADLLQFLDKHQEAEGYFLRAEKVANAHGFFSVECEANFGLGNLAMKEGREKQGVDLLRNALVCVPLFEEEDTILELNVLHAFTNALFQTNAIDEAEPLVARFLEAAKAHSDKHGRLSDQDVYSCYANAHLHEVLCSCNPVWDII